MAFKQTILIISLVGVTMIGSGCASNTSHQVASTSTTVRFAKHDNNHNPMAIGSGDVLGTSLYRTYNTN